MQTLQHSHESTDKRAGQPGSVQVRSSNYQRVTVCSAADDLKSKIRHNIQQEVRKEKTTLRRDNLKRNQTERQNKILLLS